MYGMNSRLVKADGNCRKKCGSQEAVRRGHRPHHLLVGKKPPTWLKTGSRPGAPQTHRILPHRRPEDIRRIHHPVGHRETEAMVDFTNGFTETYGDPLGLKASWEGYANFKDLEATARTEKLSANAQWFEDHSPVDDRFKSGMPGGIGQSHQGGHPRRRPLSGLSHRHQPPTPTGCGRNTVTKSVTIGNLTDAYNKAAHGNGFLQEFVIDDETLRLLRPLPRHLRRPAYRPARMPRAWKRQTPAGRGPRMP